MGINVTDAMAKQPPLVDDAERAAAERSAAKEAADKARRAGVSFAPSSPGRNSLSSSKQKTGSKSVRESIAEAIQTHRGDQRY
jgi:hypothetical protein